MTNTVAEGRTLPSQLADNLGRRRTRVISSGLNLVATRVHAKLLMNMLIYFGYIVESSNQGDEQDPSSFGESIR